MNHTLKLLFSALFCAASLAPASASAKSDPPARARASYNNMRFEQLPSSPMQRGRRTQIIVSGEKGRYMRVQSKSVRAWLTYKEAGPVPGIPGLKGTQFLINQKHRATVTSRGKVSDPIALRFPYHAPKVRRGSNDPVAMCNQKLRQDPRVAEGGTEVLLRSAYMTKITIRRLLVGNPGRGFIPKRVKVVTGTPIDAVVLCQPLPGAQKYQQRAPDGSTTQRAAVKRPAKTAARAPRARRTNNSGSQKKTPSGRPIKELFKRLTVSGKPNRYRNSGGQSCPSTLFLEAIVETSGTFNGKSRFGVPGRRLDLKELKVRAPYRMLIKDSAQLSWDTLPPDSDGIKRQTVRASFSVLDSDGKGVTMSWEDIPVACRK